MPALSNLRRERFALNLAAGMPMSEAYIDAGFSAATAKSNASNISKSPDIAARIVELKEGLAKKMEVTVQDIVRQLDEDRAFAIQCGTASAAVAATMNKAKVLGLVVDKVDNKLSNPDGSLAPREVIIKAG